MAHAHQIFRHLLEIDSRLIDLDIALASVRLVMDSVGEKRAVVAELVSLAAIAAAALREETDAAFKLFGRDEGKPPGL